MDIYYEFQSYVLDTENFLFKIIFHMIDPTESVVLLENFLELILNP